MNKLLYFLFGRKTVVNATTVKFTRTAMKRIRNAGWFIGHKAYITRDYTRADTFVATTDKGVELFWINLKGEYSHAL